MKPTANNQKPSLEHFEAWLRSTPGQQAPDVTERVLESVHQAAPHRIKRPTPVLGWGIGIAAAVALILFLTHTQDISSGSAETEYAAQAYPVADMIIDNILLEEAPMESVVWLLEEENHFTLASYLPVTN